MAILCMQELLLQPRPLQLVPVSHTEGHQRAHALHPRLLHLYLGDQLGLLILMALFELNLSFLRLFLRKRVRLAGGWQVVSVVPLGVPFTAPIIIWFLPASAPVSSLVVIAAIVPISVLTSAPASSVISIFSAVVLVLTVSGLVEVARPFVVIMVSILLLWG